MTAPIYGDDAPDVEDFVACWLQPLVRAATERKLSDPWPFVLVQRISGSDDPETGLDDPVVQLDILHKTNNAGEAKLWANNVHRRMTLLSTYPAVVVSDGSTVELDGLTVLIRPKREPFGDETVVRFMARYKLGLTYAALGT